MSEFHHVSVLLEECIQGLAIKPEGIYVDGTLGGAGHSSRIAALLTTGRLVGIDRDPVQESGWHPTKIGSAWFTPISANWIPPWTVWESAEWTAFCWIWAYRLPSWMTGSGAFPIWWTHPWICG